jgi:hypothetical protein
MDIDNGQEMENQARMERVLSTDQLDEQLREAFVEPINLGERPPTGPIDHPLDTNALFFKPIRPGISFQCRISRVMEFQTRFDLFLEDSSGGERYVMSATKKLGSDPKYLIYHKSEKEITLGCVT